MNYAEILCYAYPNSLWLMEDANDYSTLKWDESNIDPMPTKSELDKIWEKLPYNLECEKVEQNRLVAYQKTADPLFFGYQRGDNTEQAWLDAVQAVKDANPYPEVAN